MRSDEKVRTVLCVGETMALVVPTTTERLRDASLFHVDAGGAESNVAAHLAALGEHATWFSRLGDDELGRRIVTMIGDRGVDVSSVVFDPEAPTGVYFKDPGHGVLYYRAASAASRLTTKDVDKISLDGVSVLHISGITAALSRSAAEFLYEVMKRARKSSVFISFDVNYRPPLSTPKEAAQQLRDFAEHADLVFVGRDEAHTLWATGTAQSIRDIFPTVPFLVVKDGAVGATEFSGGDKVFEPSKRVDVVEVVGAGDAFAGGYLAGLLAGESTAGRLRAGHRRAALTLQTTTDFTDQSGSPS